MRNKKTGLETNIDKHRLKYYNLFRCKNILLVLAFSLPETKGVSVRRDAMWSYSIPENH